MSAALRIVIVPPYCGVPRLSHQLPAIVVVVVAIVVGAVVAVVLVVVDVFVSVDVVDDVAVDVLVDVVQDAINIAAISKKLKPNQINLFFNFLLLLISHRHFFKVIAIINAIIRN